MWLQMQVVCNHKQYHNILFLYTKTERQPRHGTAVYSILDLVAPTYINSVWVNARIHTRPHAHPRAPPLAPCPLICSVIGPASPPTMSSQQMSLEFGKFVVVVYAVCGVAICRSLSWRNSEQEKEKLGNRTEFD